MKTDVREAARLAPPVSAFSHASHEPLGLVEPADAAPAAPEQHRQRGDEAPASASRSSAAPVDVAPVTSPGAAPDARSEASAETRSEVSTATPTGAQSESFSAASTHAGSAASTDAQLEASPATSAHAGVQPASSPAASTHVGSATSADAQLEASPATSAADFPAAPATPPIPSVADLSVSDSRRDFVRSIYELGAAASTEQLAEAAETMNALLGESDDPALLVQAAWMLTAGRGYAADPERARALLDVAAGTGCGDALFELYLYDLHGIGGSVDADRAVEHLRAAADAGSVRAMANLGALHATGDGVVRDQELSIAWYRRAADGGNAKVAAMLATMFADGVDAPHDARLAERYATIASRSE